MRLKWKWIIFLLILLAGGAFLYPKVTSYWKNRNKVDFRTAKVQRGEITIVVNSTGIVQPVLRVSVGSVVSGPISKLFVDFNSQVKKGDLMAKIDPRIYNAAVARDNASVATAHAEVSRVEALLQQARNDEKRALALRKENKDYISDTEVDKFRFTRQSLEAQLAVAHANVQQAEASLQNSKANLSYTDVLAPVDGVVIDRKIDEGQTLAAQFQTPEMFVVAPDMEKRMNINASVDEADIGMIRMAQQRKEKVQFTVDAYPNDLFEGEITQIRLNPTTTQNVVTYTVIVTAPNEELKLLPGMTANLSFEVDHRNNIIKIPNAALRFYPKREQVRPEDHAILEGYREETDDEKSDASKRSANQRISAIKERSKRHVWQIGEGNLLKAVTIIIGVSDNEFSELLEGGIKEEDILVTGINNLPGG